MAAFHLSIRRFFRIYDDEVVKILLFAALGAVLQCGIAIGVSAADALFLNHIGAAALPTVYVLSPFVIIAYIASHTLLISRLNIERVCTVTLVLLGLIILSLSVFLDGGSNTPAWVYYAVKLTSMVAYVALYTLYWNVADSYFTIIDAKRLFAYLSAGCAIGAAVGGAVVFWLSSYMPVEQFFLLWALLSLFGIPIANRIRTYCKRLDGSSREHRYEGFGSEVRKLTTSFRQSSFAFWITASLFLTVFVSLLCEYQYYGILSIDRNEREIASLLGQLNCAVSIFNLVVNLFLFNRLVEWMGVRNVALLQSLAYCSVFCLLVVEHTEFAAILGFFVYHGLFISIDGNNFNLLLNALPDRERKQLRTFIEGICEPMANVLVGGGLILSATALSPVQVSELGLAAAVLCFLTGLMVRTRYVSAMIQNLRARWLDFSRPATNRGFAFPTLGSSQSVATLLDQASHSSPADRRLIETQITALGNRAVPTCVRVLHASDQPLRSRSLAARALRKISFSQLESMATELVNQSLLEAYDTYLWDKQLTNLDIPEGLQKLALKFSSDKRTAQLEFMLEILTLSGRLAGFEPIAASLRSQDPKARGTAIEAVEQSCSRSLRLLLRPLLDEREVDRRLVLARQLCVQPSPSAHTRIIRSLHSHDEIEAAIGLELLGALDLHEASTHAHQYSSKDQGSLLQKTAHSIIERSRGCEVDSPLLRAAALIGNLSMKDLSSAALITLAESSSNGTNQQNASESLDFNLEHLMQQARTDYWLGLSLYELVRRGTDARKALT